MVSRHLKKISLLLFFFVFLLACEEKSDWLTFRGENGNGVTATSVHPPLALKWKLRLQEKEDKALAFNPPIIMDETIYFGSYDGNFYALDIQSGYMRWIFKTGGHINSIPCADETAVYFGSDDGKVYAVERRTGKLLWSFATGELVQSLLMRYKDMVVFVTNVGAGYFLNTAGQLLFTIPNYIWSKYTFNIFDGIMYFAPSGLSSEFGLSTFDINFRTYGWELGLDVMNGDWYSVGAVDKDRVYGSTAAYGGDIYYFNFYALDRRDGRALWIKSEQSEFGKLSPNQFYDDLFLSYIELLDYLAPALWHNLVIYTAGDSVVRAFAKDSGLKVWEKKFDYNTTSAPTIASGRLYFGLDGNGLPKKSPSAVAPRLICLAASDGRVLWTTEIEGRILSSPVIAGRWIVFGTDEHVFYVMEEVF